MIAQVAQLRLCRPYPCQNRAAPSRLLPSTGLVDAAGMRLLQAAAESRILAAPAAQLLQAVHTAAIQRLISAAYRAVTHLFAGRLKGPVASSAAHAHERAEHRSNASGRLACFIPRARTALRRLCCP